MGASLREVVLLPLIMAILALAVVEVYCPRLVLGLLEEPVIGGCQEVLVAHQLLGFKMENQALVAEEDGQVHPQVLMAEEVGTESLVVEAEDTP